MKFLPLFLLFVSTISFAIDTPPRLYFADAKLSMGYADGWELESSFPNGPLFRKSDAGSPASISCQTSTPVDALHLSENWTAEQLHQAADEEVKRICPTARVLHSAQRLAAGHTAWEVTWEEPGQTPALQNQAVLFFAENRLYAITLHGRADNMLDRVPEFQRWLESLTMLSTKDAGHLDAPAHGGLWIHQTGGVRIPIPEAWLIGVSDDRTLGAAIALGSQHSDFTASFDPGLTETHFSAAEKAEARAQIEKKRGEVLRASEELFHGMSALALVYQTQRNERTVRGQDLWIASPKGRWLLSIEADLPLFRKMTPQYNALLDAIEFF